MKKPLFFLVIVLLLPVLSYAEVAVIMKDGVIFHWRNYTDIGDKYCTYGGSFCISKSDVKEIKEGDNLPAEYRHESKGEGIARYSDNVIRRVLASQQEREQQIRALKSFSIDDRQKIKGEMMERLIKYGQRPNIYKKEIEVLNSAIESMEGSATPKTPEYQYKSRDDSAIHDAERRAERAEYERDRLEQNQIDKEYKEKFDNIIKDLQKLTK